MNRILRLFATSAASAALVTTGATLAAGVSTASASAAAHPFASAAAPPWEPDPNSVGSLIFYNSSGQVITGGSLTDQPVAAYVLGTNTVRAGDTKASLWGFLPVNGTPIGQWSGEELGTSTTYPNASAPGSLATTALPLETGGATDESIATLELDFPNTDTSDDGYANMYQLRLYTSKPGEGISTQYDSADIEVDNSAGAGTWSVFYAPLPTSTTLKTSASTIVKGQSITLTSTETPVVAGTVQFYDGTTAVGSPVSSPSGTATLATTALSAGVEALKAVFTPSDTNLNEVSTSSVVDVTVQTATTTSLSASPTSITKGQKITFTSTTSPANAGTVQFYDGSSKLGTPVTVSSKGVATYATATLPAGSQAIAAYFYPTSSLYTRSSKGLTVIVRTPTTTKLSASPTTITKGQKITLTATESPAEAGSITFYDGKTGLIKVTVSKGVATYVTTTLPAGTLTLIAYYVPSSSLYAGSSASVKVTVKS
jgi:hypothetical protein